ncbi:spore coat SP96 precursor [Paramyrothecium foliicola]|nr:spore coat SP96 precursor [Paramyrothecium foliicola]
MIYNNHGATILALAAGIGSAHVIMIEPHPYNLDTAPLLQTWPLSADLPFPCQGRFQHAEEVTTVTAGTTQTVKFWGSAVHGGGSCQFSVAYGTEPPVDPAAWHTIYSLIGGCPAEAEGNIPTDSKDPHGREHGPQCGNDSGKECTRQFNIPIPKNMKNGPAIFAWTWFNKIGNREMYMNCAPIEVVGGVEDSSFVQSLPPIFRANIPGECTTGTSGSVIGFPDAGEFGKVYQPIDPGSNGSCEPAGDASFDDSVAKPALPSGAPTGSPSATSPSTPSEKPSSTSALLSSPTIPIPPSPTTYQNSSTIQLPAPTPTTDSQSAPSSRPAWAEGMEPCDVSGSLVCLKPGFFGICNNGWVLPQALAVGTSCTDGRITAS